MRTIKLLKKQYLLAALLLLSGVYLQAQVTVGADNAPLSVSALELISNQTRGLRLPQMTEAEKITLVGTAEFIAERTGKAKGLMVFNTDTKCVNIWNGKKWIEICAESESEPEPENLTFSPNFNIDSISVPAHQNLDGVFAARTATGIGDTRNRGVGFNQPAIDVGVFRYIDGNGGRFKGVDTTLNGITVTVLPAVLASGEGGLNVEVSGTPDNTTAGKTFDIPITVLGSVLYVRVNVGCGAYIAARTPSSPTTTLANGGDGAWKQFQCFNIGAETDRDPFLPHKKLHGNLYKWGLRDVAAYPADNENPNFFPTALYGVPYQDHPDWVARTRPVSTAVGGVWDMVNENPCPPGGWRVPTQTQVLSLVEKADQYTYKYNRHTPYGDWNTVNTHESQQEDDAWLNGVMVGSALFFPAAGVRGQDGYMGQRGINGLYWATESPTTTNTGGFRMLISKLTANANLSLYRKYGSTIRCVAND